MLSHVARPKQHQASQQMAAHPSSMAKKTMPQTALRGILVFGSTFRHQQYKSIYIYGRYFFRQYD